MSSTGPRDFEVRQPVHIPPLVGDVVCAWPMLADEKGKMALATDFQLGGDDLTPDRATMANLAAALGELVEEEGGEIEAEAMEAQTVGEQPVSFTHRVHIAGDEWPGPPDWAVRVEAEEAGR
jgi:hypothetical protein